MERELGFYAPPNTPMTGFWETGHLVFNFTSNNNVFGFWCSPLTSVMANRLYRVRFFISTNIPDPAKFPILRMRTNSADGSFAAYTSITSSNQGELSPTPSLNKSYDLFFVPSSTAVLNGMYFTVDIINIDPNDISAGKVHSI